MEGKEREIEEYGVKPLTMNMVRPFSVILFHRLPSKKGGEGWHPTWTERNVKSKNQGHFSRFRHSLSLGTETFLSFTGHLDRLTA